MGNDAQLAPPGESKYNCILMVTYIPSKLGQTDLVFGLWLEFMSRSVHAGLQVSLYNGYDLGHSG